MKILLFDTETTGLMIDRAPLEEHPHIVQIAGMFFDYKDGQILNQIVFDKLFNPTVPIPESASSVHGFTDEMVKDKPLFETFAKEFIKYANEADYIVGHNVQFDRKMVFSEIDRIWMGYSDRKMEWKQKFKAKEICTMLSSMDFVGIPGRYGKNKRPKLDQLHQKLFKCGFDNAHNALGDVEATAKCFVELEKKGLIKMK